MRQAVQADGLLAADDFAGELTREAVHQGDECGMLERLAAGDDDVVEPGTGDFGEQRVQRRLTATVDAHEYFVSHQAHPTEQP